MGGPSQFDPDFPLYIYLGNEAGEYDPERRLELPTGGGTNTYVLADLDQDGYADLAIVSPEGLRIFHGGPDGLAPDRYSILAVGGQMIHYVLVGDFNRDGWLDLLAVAYTYDDKPETKANSSVIFHGSAAGFSSERSTGLPTYCGGNAQVADVNQDGWLDLIAVVMGHYTRKESGFYILYGGPEGFAEERIEFHPTEASSILISVADLNNDGHLDLLVPAYSTKFTRELPAHVYWGNGAGFDFDYPLVIPCDSSCAFLAIDISGNGYRDLLTVCHRNDLGHQVDSLLFWNGPDGLSFDRVTRLPGLGPHLTSPRDFGNAFTREPLENYVSPAWDMKSLTPVKLRWEAQVPEKTALKFQLRRAESVAALGLAPWMGPAGEGSFYEESGSEIEALGNGGEWLQYKAIFVSHNGCRSPSLEEVRVDFAR